MASSFWSAFGVRFGGAVSAIDTILERGECLRGARGVDV
jgi:hypothetical protein